MVDVPLRDFLAWVALMLFELNGGLVSLLSVCCWGAINFVLVSDRFFGLIAMRRRKSGGVFFLEIFILYFLFLYFFRFLESLQNGTPYRKGWEFYAIFACLMMVGGFPGFVYRHLWKKGAGA